MSSILIADTLAVTVQNEYGWLFLDTRDSRRLLPTRGAAGNVGLAKNQPYNRGKMEIWVRDGVGTLE